MATVIHFLISFFILSTASAKPYLNVTLGSSLFADTSLSSWISPSGEFAFGFYPQGEGHFIVAIWFARIPENTVIWAYNQERPHVPSNSTVRMTMDGRLILQTTRGEFESISTNNEPASSASMLNSGNFVLYNSDSDIIWESFSSPTDSIVQGQKLLAGSVLYSSVSRTDSTKGRFRLNMQADGNLVQYPVEGSNTANYAYWASDTETAGDDVTLNLNENGYLYLLNHTGFTIKNLSAAANTSDETIFYRITIDWDGILRLYSLGRGGNWSIMWSSSYKKCDPWGLCGVNSYCALLDQESTCICLGGFNFLDSSQPMLGCRKNTFAESCEELDNTIYRQENTVWRDNPYSILSSTDIEDCTKLCLADCICEAAIFRNLQCRKQSLPMRYGKRDSFTLNASTVLTKVTGRKLYSKEKSTKKSTNLGRRNAIVLEAKAHKENKFSENGCSKVE